MTPVDRITIHHEGAGSPSDVPRGADGGYSYWCGASRWEHLRDVWHSFATLRFNHVSLDICLSGNRQTGLKDAYGKPIPAYPVADSDLDLIRGACNDARARGYVVDSPQVVAHRNSPGSSTVCPGDLTILRWNDVVAACTRQVPNPPVVKVKPMYDPPLGPIAAVWQDNKGRVLAAVAPNGDVYAWGVPYRSWPSKQKDFGDRQAATIAQAPGLSAGRYVITATTGETYTP